jgi:hypothetical protein
MTVSLRPLARIMSCVSALLLILLAPTAHAASPILQSQAPCTVDPSFGNCLTFNSAAPAFSARTFNFDAPSAGNTLVSVNGSGYCENSSSDVKVAEFDSQIVNKLSQVADYSKPGGNKFKFTVPAQNFITGNVVFNLSSQRLFAVSSAGRQHYALNINVNRVDSPVVCAVKSLWLTALFIPQ